MIEAAAVVTLGWLFIDTPLPMVLGPWGTPARWPDFNGTNYTFQFQDDAIWIPRQTLLYEQAATRFFQQCNDEGTNIVCPGPIGHAFSWEISESLPSNCWFGSDHCFYGSKTITQRATLSPSDMGILRNNGMSITIAAECSHVNSSGFTQRLVDSGNNPITNYNFGSASSDPSNRTLTVYDSEALINPRNYRPLVFTWLQGGLDWVPAPFLTERIELPFLSETKNASSALTVIFNHLLGLLSGDLNVDPFFLSANDTDSNGQYPSGQNVSILACRDHYELRIEPKNFSATGTFADIFGQYNSYANSHPTDFRTEYDPLMWLFRWSLDPSSLYNVLINGLVGDKMSAEKTVNDNGFQYQLSRNVTTRAELTRWFGIQVLHTLYIAQAFTSGTDNDFGFGVSPTVWTWLCESVLRDSTTYTTVRLIQMVFYITAALAVIGISYAVPWLLQFKAAKTPNVRSNRLIRDALVFQASHTLLQIHRIAVEQVTGQKFKQTLASIPLVIGNGRHDPGFAPSYGVKTDSETSDAGTELIPLTQTNAESEADVDEETDSYSSVQRYATMLRPKERGCEFYDVKSVR